MIRAVREGGLRGGCLGNFSILGGHSSKAGREKVILIIKNGGKRGVRVLRDPSTPFVLVQTAVRWRLLSSLIVGLLVLHGGTPLLAQPATSPLQLKQEARTALELISTTDKKLQRKITKAIDAINRSLSDKGLALFLDEFRIIPPRKGKKVFQRERQAVGQLLKGIAQKGSTADIKTVFQEVIDALVEADRAIAELSITNARQLVQAALGDAKDLAKAERELDKAIGETDPRKAIDGFKKAWESSQKVVKGRALSIANFQDSPDPFSPSSATNTLTATFQIRKKKGIPRDKKETEFFLEIVELILDTSKAVVRTVTTRQLLTLPPEKPKESFFDVTVTSDWDGRNDQEEIVPDGSYTYLAFGNLIKVETRGKQKEKVEATSFPVSGTIILDNTLPDSPTVFDVTSPTLLGFQAITGEAEPGSRIEITDGQEPASVKTFANGLYMVNVPLQRNSVNTLSITATDAAENTSATTEVTIVQSEELPRPTTGEATIINLVSGNNQEGVVGEPLPQPLEVIVTDPEGNPVAGEEVTFQVTMGGGTIDEVSSVTVPTDGAGKVAVSLTLGLEPGLAMVRVNFAGNQNMPAEFMATGLAPRPIEETRLSGVVMTPEFRAIPGITVIFEGTGTNEGVRLETTTTENGGFAFFNVPPGNNQLLIVQGGTATLPGPFPDLTFDIDVLPGQDNKTGRPDGKGKPIFLPLLNEGVEIPLDAEGVVLEDQVIEFSAGPGLEPIILQVPQGTRVTFPEGAERRISITRIPINRIPMPLPEGQFSRMVITVQPGGTRFDPPLPISFPNVDGAPPGTQLRLLSFVLAAGEFVEVGGATVSADGRRVESDPGVGIREGAWHATPPNPRSVVSMICAELPPETADLDCECWASSSQPATSMGGRVVCAGNVPVGISGIQPDAEGNLPDFVGCVCSFPVEVAITMPADGDVFPVGETITVEGTVSGASSVSVNGVSATVTGGTWTAEITLPATPGDKTITATATLGGASASDSVTVKVIKVDIADTVGICKDKTKGIQVTVNPSPLPSGKSITLELSKTSGTGSATFADGKTSKTITGTTTVTVKGVTQSSTKDNIKLTAKVNGREIASDTFSVVFVQLALGTSGTASNDNAARTNYNLAVGTTALGPFITSIHAGNGIEIVGTVSPSNYTGNIILRRTVNGTVFQGNTQISSKTGDDTSFPALRDDNPQSGSSGGKVYDLDAPGFPLSGLAAFPVGTILRQRGNFKQFAEFDGERCSDEISWFTRLSIKKSAAPNTWIRDNAIATDNQVRAGTTKLTADLK